MNKNCKKMSQHVSLLVEPVVSPRKITFWTKRTLCGKPELRPVSERALDLWSWLRTAHGDEACGAG